MLKKKKKSYVCIPNAIILFMLKKKKTEQVPKTATDDRNKNDTKGIVRFRRCAPLIICRAGFRENFTWN